MDVEFNGVRILAREFGTVPIELRRELRPRMRQAGEVVRREIQSAAGWSSQIPAAVRLTVAFGSKTGGVRIFVDAKKAPHARPLENMGAEGTFRHPVFGNRDNWVAQAARPFFFKTVKANREQVRSLVADAVKASMPRGARG
jgi:hypothetical protein